MTYPKQDVSVVICAYTEKRWDNLVAAVESVQWQSTPPREIIVVVDHNPGVFQRARQHFPGVLVVENMQRRGLSGARNSGIAVAQGTLIAFLDDDAVADRDWLERLSGWFDKPNVLGVGGTAIPLWQNGRPSWFPKEFDWVVGCTYHGLPQTTAPVRNPIGSSMCIRREVFEEVGGFRSGIGREGTRPVGCEETELCIRAQQRWPQRFFLYEPRARVVHFVSANRARWSYFQARCYAEGQSKAVVSRLVGSQGGLASERTYTLRTLPQGVIRGVADTILRGDKTGLARAGAIIAGLATTTVGYLMGNLFVTDVAHEPSRYEQFQRRPV